MNIIKSKTTRRTLLKSLSVLPAALTAPVRIPSRRRLLILEGNSLTSMGNGVITWSQRLAVHPWMQREGYGVVNVAIGGATIVNLFERAPLVDSLAGLVDECTLLVFELTNSIEKFGDVDAVYQRHREYCQARRAKGFKVLIGTGISRSHARFTHLDMARINDTIRSTYTEFADGVVDFAACPELGSDGASDNPRYFWDGIHVTADGSQILLETVLSALQQRAATYYMPVIGG